MAVESRNFIYSCVDLNFEIINVVARTVSRIVLNSLSIISLYAREYRLFISLRHQAPISIYPTLWAYSEGSYVVSRVDAGATHCVVIHCSLSPEWVAKGESCFDISAESGQFPDSGNKSSYKQALEPTQRSSTQRQCFCRFLQQGQLYKLQFLTKVSSAQAHLIKISKKEVLPGLSPHTPPPTLSLQTVLIIAFCLALSAASLHKHTSCQGRGGGILKYSKEYEDALKNNRTKKHIIVLGGSSSGY